MRALHVLLVEDDADHVFLVRRALADVPGTEVTVELASDGEEATERLARSRFGPGRRPSWSCSTSRCPAWTAWRCCAGSGPTRPRPTCRWWC